jgi:hypothetical protein
MGYTFRFFGREVWMPWKASSVNLEYGNESNASKASISGPLSLSAKSAEGMNAWPGRQ